METPMAAMTIRNLDDALKQRLRVRAAAHGRSMEAEAREILRTALAPSYKEPEKDLGTAIHEHFAEIGGVEFELPPREPVREPPDFSGPEYGRFDDE
jgi:plasmid stability protein